MNPEISIVVPVFNLEPYLEDCVKSILAQTFTNYEVILVNDGSTDKSGTICDEFANKHNSVKVIHQQYGGVSAARNTGINSALGNYLGFVDGDDRIEADMYMNLYNLCIETKSDIAVSKLGREINGKLINNNQEQFIKEMDHIEALRELFKGNLYRFSLCNKLFKRSCFENIQFPLGRIHEDLSITYRLFVNADKTIYTNNIGYIYIKRENSILTSRFNEKRLDAFIGWDEIITFMNKKYIQLSDEVISSFGYWCVDYVYYILNQVENKEERDQLLKSIQRGVGKYYKEIMINHPFSLKYKYIITLLKYNINLLLLTHTMKRLISKF
ncbi:MAG: glycosyltransferase [Bacillus sp. (in: Bacteria)]|nr:glycosyltransferase [Bacillus sp. (in: firmicutes)]